MSRYRSETLAIAILEPVLLGLGGHDPAMANYIVFIVERSKEAAKDRKNADGCVRCKQGEGNIPASPNGPTLLTRLSRPKDKCLENTARR